MNTLTFNDAINNIKFKIKKHKNHTLIYLTATIPFIFFMILLHKIIFLEFGLVLFALAIYNLKKIIDLSEEIIKIKELSHRIQTSTIKKVYPEGQHLIINPTNIVFDLGGYKFIGINEHGIKIYQNITDVIVYGHINETNGEVVYDEYGIPSYFINE